MLPQAPASSPRLYLKISLGCLPLICSGPCLLRRMKILGQIILTLKKRSPPWSLHGHICKLCMSFCCGMWCRLKQMRSWQKDTLIIPSCSNYWTSLIRRILGKESTLKPYYTEYMASLWYIVPSSGKQSTTSFTGSFLRLRNIMA